ncbi:unnamed protein product [Rhizophagus irregularis]|nr:unnamed protein product [Rhizophagus irregularis]
MVVQAVAQAVLLASFLILAIRRLRACVLKLYFRSSFDFCFEGSVFLYIGKLFNDRTCSCCKLYINPILITCSKKLTVVKKFSTSHLITKLQKNRECFSQNCFCS